MRDKLQIQRAVADLAGAQHGVVAARQLVELGWSREAISRMVRSGRLHRIHRGVYAVGHAAITEHGRGMAAILACGPGSVLSHWSAAWLWGLVPRIGKDIDVTAPTVRHRRPGIRPHFAATLLPRDVDVVAEIPVTALPMTMLGLAPRARWLGSMLGRAERQYDFDLRAFDDLIERSDGAHGVAALRKAVEEFRRPAFSRSGLERRFLALVAEARLPLPILNFAVEGLEVDAYWPALRFGVELDGYEYHRGQRSFESDRERDEDLRLAGIETLRITDRRIANDPRGVQDRLRLHLERRAHALPR
jgi:predicted transcriptional regulator of viral defense system